LIEIGINRKRGFIDNSGKLVIRPMFEFVWDFSEGLAPACLHEKWGYIDKTGKIVIKPQFQEAQSFSEGLARVQLPNMVTKSGNRIAGKYGFIDKTGTFIIRPQFEHASSFQNGLASASIRVRKESSKSDAEVFSGYIDKTGTFIIKPDFQDVAHSFQGPYSRATKIYRKDQQGNILSSEEGLIDKTGKFVFSEKKDTGKHDPFLEKGYVIVNMKNGSANTKPRMVAKKFKKGAVDNTYPQFEGMSEQIIQKQINKKLHDIYFWEYTDISSDYWGSFNLTWNKNSIVSFTIDTFHYPHGTPHGQPHRLGYTISAENGKIFALNDLFQPNTAWLKKIDAYARSEIKRRIDEKELSLFGSFKGIIGGEQFYLSEKSNTLVIFYDVYEIAAYCYGVVSVEIPLKELQDVIKPEFRLESSAFDTQTIHNNDILLQSYKAADKELNDTFKALMSELSQVQKAALKKDEIFWIKQKKSACKELKDKASLLKCQIEMTNDRIKILKAWPRDK